MRRVFALLVLAIVLAPACKDDKDKTKIVVAVWSDLAVPSVLDTIRIEASGTETNSKTFTLTAAGAADKSKPLALLMLAPLGAKNATITVKAVGMHDPTELVAQTARVSFVSGQALLLKLVLSGDCRDKTCTSDHTCAYGVCNRPVVVESLPPYEPGKPITAPDAGVRIDGGVTIDGSTIDSKGSEAAVDTRVTDASAPGLGTGGSPDVGPPPRDTGGTASDAPLGGTGGAIISTGTGGAGGTGGAIINTGIGGTGGTGGTGKERCVFGTSRFGNCVLGP